MRFTSLHGPPHCPKCRLPSSFYMVGMSCEASKASTKRTSLPMETEEMADDEAGRRAATQVVALAGEVCDVAAGGAQEGDAFHEPSFSPWQAPSSPPHHSTSRTAAASLGARISNRPTSRLLAHRGVCGSRSTGRLPLLLPLLGRLSHASSAGRSKETRPPWWLRIPSPGTTTTRWQLRRTRRPWQRHMTPRRITSPQGLVTCAISPTASSRFTVMAVVRCGGSRKDWQCCLLCA